MTERPRLGLTNIVLLVVPLILAAGVVLLFLETGGGLRFAAPAPVEALTVERTVLRPGAIELQVRNAGPEPVTVAQAIVNDAIWPMTVTPGPTLGRLQRATVHIPYLWTAGEAYAVRLFTGNGIPFDATIPVAWETPGADARTLLGFTLIGVYVGIIPIFLGLFWFPALRRLGRPWMVFLLAVTAGLLVFLGIDTLAEAIDQSGRVPGPFQGVGLIGIGAVAAFLLLEVISRSLRSQRGAGRGESGQRLALAYMVATGIGLHNLGEGLAIGAAYSVGEVSLGTFLVVGFIVQNITEGLGIMAPILRDRPSVSTLAILGAIGGGPAVAGTWLGGLAPSPTLAVLFLGVGAGAIFQVAWQIAAMIRRDTAAEGHGAAVLVGAVAGMLLLWTTGLLIK